MARRDLDVTERYAGVEGGHHEPRSEHVRMDKAHALSFPDCSYPAVSRAAV